MFGQDLFICLPGFGPRVLQVVHCGKLRLLLGPTTSALIVERSVRRNAAHSHILNGLSQAVLARHVHCARPHSNFLTLWLPLLNAKVAVLRDIRVRFKLLRFLRWHFLKLLVQLLQTLRKPDLLRTLIFILQSLCQLLHHLFST